MLHGSIYTHLYVHHVYACIYIYIYIYIYVYTQTPHTWLHYDISHGGMLYQIFGAELICRVLSGGAHGLRARDEKKADQLEQPQLIQKLGKGCGSRTCIETTTATTAENIASSFLAPSSYVESLWRRAQAKGAQRKKGRPTRAASAHPIHHQRARDSGRDEGGYREDRPGAKHQTPKSAIEREMIPCSTC